MFLKSSGDVSFRSEYHVVSEGNVPQRRITGPAELPVRVLSARPLHYGVTVLPPLFSAVRPRVTEFSLYLRSGNEAPAP